MIRRNYKFLVGQIGQNCEKSIVFSDLCFPSSFISVLMIISCHIIVDVTIFHGVKFLRLYNCGMIIRLDKIYFFWHTVKPKYDVTRIKPKAFQKKSQNSFDEERERTRQWEGMYLWTYRHAILRTITFRHTSPQIFRTRHCLARKNNCILIASFAAWMRLSQILCVYV